ASIAMQTVVNPIVFGKPISSSLHDLVTNIGNESKDLALLHMGGKMLPHQISILHKEMQQWDTEIQKSLGIVFTKIHEARIENETRWLTDTTYQSGLRITAGCVAAGLAASVIPHDSTLCLPLILGTTEPTTPTRRPSVKWPDAIDVTNAWKIFKAIYESPAGEPSPTKQDFIQRMREEPPFRAWFYDCLGRVSTRTVLLVIWMGGDKLVHYKQLARLLAKEPALEAACWESIHERVPLWRELGLDPKAHFEEMTRAESELAMIRKEATERLGPEAGESSWTSELLTLNNLIGMRRIAMIIASRDAMRERVREISTDAADFDRQARTLEGMISENLAYLLLRKLDCETGKYTHPQSYHDERSQPAFEQAYEVLRQAVIRVYEAKSEGMEGLLSTAITQQMDKIKAGGWTSYDEISKARHENDVIPSLVDAGPYLISCLYLHLLRDVPFERLALERLTSSTEGELTTYREARRAKQAAVPEELFNLLVTTEFMVKFLQKARYQLSEGKITELDQIQIAALSTSAIQIIGHFNTAFESAIARRAAPAWQRYSEKNVSENYVRNEILHPLSVLRTTIGKKIEAAAPDSPDLGPLNLIDQALLSCYDRVTEITGIFSALN
ncbi:MAG: hypothetical protein HYT76_08340, partial [Deltaproteobacteria bacterium]|nr:hypothetical protein [Deltaproteobacteria bacterium]